MARSGLLSQLIGSRPSGAVQRAISPRSGLSMKLQMSVTADTGRM
jgi:hypothetical protein